MEKDKKKTVFVRQPEYPGGPKALTQFIYEQLRYPAAASEAQAEGTVLVEYDIDYRGNVVATRIVQGLGHGCDEEAARIVRLLKFDVPTNRNMKVLFHQKVRVQFKKPVPVAPAVAQLTYVVIPNAPAMTKPEEQPVMQTYSYIVQF